MRALFVEHDHVSPPGPVAERFRARGYEVVEAQVVPRERFGAPNVTFDFPAVDDFDVVVPMGAPWGAWDDDTIGAWLAPELEWLRCLQAADVPILGICFGGQALARALGGSVAPGPAPEIGLTWVSSSAPDLVPAGPWFHWHFDRWTLPPGAVELARTPLASQAYRVGRSLAVQFHPEVTPSGLRGWLDEGGRASVERRGMDADALLQQVVDEEATLVARAEMLVDAFLDRVAVDS